MRTTIDINDALLRDLRQIAAAQKKPFRRVVEETLQKGMCNESSDTNPPISIPVHDLGLKAAYRGMSLNQLYDQLEAEDVPTPEPSTPMTAISTAFPVSGG